MITLTPSGPLSDRIARFQQSVDTAQNHLYRARMHDVARVVRDALPGATWLLLDTNDLPDDVVLRTIGGPGNPEMWFRGEKLPAALAAYRTTDGSTWAGVVRHLECALVTAIGTTVPGRWWEPRDDYGTEGIFYATLPTAADAAEFQAVPPQHPADRCATASACAGGGPVPGTTMSVAGGAITVSVEADGVVTVGADPAGTPVEVISAAGPGIPVRIRLAHSAAVLPPPRGDATAGQEAGTAVNESVPWSCRAEDRTPESSSSWGEPDTVSLRPAPAPCVRVSNAGALEYLVGWFDGDSKMRYSGDVADDRHDNGRRAGFAATTLLAFARHTGLLDQDTDTSIVDLLGDLRHLCDALHLDFHKLDRTGERHYTAELRGEP